MTELDDALRQSFARIAEPGDPAGVVDAMRARMAAGDTGTPAATSGFTSGAGWVIPWIFGGALLAIGGLVLGTSGLLTPVFSPQLTSQTVQVQSTVAALDCPSGEPVATLAAGNRVLAISRSDDGAFVGVRNPYNTSNTVWLPVALVIADSDQPAFDSLPVDGCGEATTTQIEPTAEATPTPTETQEPQQPTPPAPVADATKPTLGNPTATPNTDICADDSYSAYYAISSLIAVTAADNVGVTGVSISWTGVATGSGQMTGGPTNWSYSFNPPQSTPSGNVTFVLQARDAAGNLSGAKQTAVAVISSGSCLI
jgi:hypothetical protein